MQGWAFSDYIVAQDRLPDATIPVFGAPLLALGIGWIKPCGCGEGGRAGLARGATTCSIEIPSRAVCYFERRSQAERRGWVIGVYSLGELVER